MSMGSNMTKILMKMSLIALTRAMMIGGRWSFNEQCRAPAPAQVNGEGPCTMQHRAGPCPSGSQGQGECAWPHQITGLSCLPQELRNNVNVHSVWRCGRVPWYPQAGWRPRQWSRTVSSGGKRPSKYRHRGTVRGTTRELSVSGGQSCLDLQQGRGRAARPCLSPTATRPTATPSHLLPGMG